MSVVIAWAKAHGRLVLIGAGVLAVLVIVWLIPHGTPPPEPERRTIDSLAITKPTFDSARTATIRSETVFVRQAAHAARQDTISGRRADSLGRVADSLQRVAEARHDTSSTWRSVALARAAEVADLRDSRDSARSALADERSARLEADHRASLDSARLVAVEGLNTRLAKDLARADPPCRLLGLLRCPSRTATAVTTTLIAAGVTLLATHR